MRLLVFEDARVADLEPLSLSRPAFELCCGISSLLEKQKKYFGHTQADVWLRPHLVEVYRETQPSGKVNCLDSEHDLTLLVNARYLPPSGRVTFPAFSFVATCNDELAYAVLPTAELACLEQESLETCLALWKTGRPEVTAPGCLLRYLWELVARNAEQIDLDFAASSQDLEHWRPGNLTLIGAEDRLCLHPSARIDPFVVADTSNGAVIVDAGAVLTSFTRLEGPCYIGPRTHVHGAQIRAGTSVGPNCRLGGELECSIIQGHTNKYHEGFLGHSYLGEWVNLGAGTHTSDLRFDYGTVKITVNGKRVSTGQLKVGSFIGDHTKTALGCLLNTGSNIGVFTHLLPCGELLPRYVPSFCQTNRDRLVEGATLEMLFQAAEKATRRRNLFFSAIQRQLYQTLYQQLAGERRRTLHDTELRRLRRSA
jgi:UDP-N-acetylglucosamine diphosphorylase/glucosamine-1-phosphate N-acetyltransferase